MENKHNNLEERIMSAIKSGQVAMRPRWHFVLRAALIAVGGILLLLTLLYIAGLSVFFLRQQGGWFAPMFGPRGWFIFFRSLPWLLIGIAVIFIGLLEILVQRYAFAYRKPLWYSVFAIFAIVFAGGLLLAIGPFHGRVFPSRRNGPMGRPFERHFGPPQPHDIHRVEVLETASSSLIVRNLLSDVTSTVLITPETRLPADSSIAPGDLLIVFGDRASGTIRAFGIQEVEE